MVSGRGASRLDRDDTTWSPSSPCRRARAPSSLATALQLPDTPRDDAHVVSEAYEPRLLDTAPALMDGADQRVQAPRVPGCDGREYEVRLHPGWRETCRGGSCERRETGAAPSVPGWPVVYPQRRVRGSMVRAPRPPAGTACAPCPRRGFGRTSGARAGTNPPLSAWARACRHGLGRGLGRCRGTSIDVASNPGERSRGRFSVEVEMVEIMNPVRRRVAYRTAVGGAVVACVVLAGGCSGTAEDVGSDGQPSYKSSRSAPPLEVPPDLSSSRGSRYAADPGCGRDVLAVCERRAAAGIGHRAGRCSRRPPTPGSSAAATSGGWRSR